MLEWLHGTHLQWVVGFVFNVANGAPLLILVHGGFYALPNKVPHRPIANARRLQNVATTWKFIREHIACQYVPLLTHGCVLLQFALHAPTCVAHRLRVIQHYIW